MVNLDRIGTISTAGTGRRDYSTNIEYMVEPLIRSYQSVYTLKLDFAGVPSGAALIQQESLAANNVIMLYNFNISASSNHLFRATIRVVAANGTTLLMVHRWAYGSFSQIIPRGFPFANAIRVAVTNYSSDTQDYIFSCSGLETDETIYVLQSDLSAVRTSLTV